MKADVILIGIIISSLYILYIVNGNIEYNNKMQSYVNIIEGTMNDKFDGNFNNWCTSATVNNGHIAYGNSNIQEGDVYHISNNNVYKVDMQNGKHYIRIVHNGKVKLKRVNK